MDCYQKKIIVIGAGMSGLACASCLIDYGFENVLILEAKDRIGGRIETVYDSLTCEGKEYFFELGAEWIHGEDSNAIFELAHSKGLVNEAAANYYEALTNFNLLHSEKECEVIKSFFIYLDDKTEGITEDISEDISLSDFLGDAFSEFIVNFQNASMVEILKGAFDWYCKLHCELSGATNLAYVSSQLLNQYQECPGVQNVQLKFGYKSVLKLIYEKIPNNAIFLKNVVEKVDWSDFKTNNCINNEKNLDTICECKGNIDKKVKIFCNGGQIYEADHVIITIPLGSLKKQYDTLFYPALSENKIKAIQNIGFGTVNKIFLLFQEPFWESTAVYPVIWNKSLNEKFEASDENSIIWLKCINRFAFTAGHPNMLCAWVVGEGAITMENLSDKEITSQCVDLLEKITGKQLPKPLKIFRSNWFTDPEAHGSYSYLSLKSNKNSNFQLAEPEISNVFCNQHPVLQFAGEATHAEYFSTVHGAYESGLREAQRLMNHYRYHVSSNIFPYIQTKLCGGLRFQKPLHQNMKILIIGAGIAGLTVAYSLYEKGFRNFFVLEAQDKIGGRISTLALGDEIIETGAQWLHGTSNLLYDFSNSNNLLCDSSDEPSYEGEGLFYTSDGGLVEMSVVQEVKCVLNTTKLHLCEGQYNNHASKSVKNIFEESFNSHFTHLSGSPLPTVYQGLLNWFLKFEAIDNACDSLGDVAVQCYSEWCEIPDEEYHINFKNGFSSVVDAISCELPRGCLLLKKPVRRINWKSKLVLPQYSENSIQTLLLDNFQATVECEDGDDIAANIVILTASVGYIKENIHTLFKPHLPEEKANAFTNIGFGTINKIFLIYEIPFWGVHDQGFQLVWTANLDEDLKILLKEHPWIDGITGFDIAQKTPNILVGWIGGIGAKIIESIDTDTVSNVCTKLLRIFLKSPDIPYPVKTIRTCWFDNNYIKGAYSYRSCKFHQSNSKLEDLQSPLCTNYEVAEGKAIQWPVVYFAGEGLNENSFASVHGAFESGLKTAEDIDSICSKIEDCGWRG